MLAVATLHVRNVPDDLYERLRAAAEEDGRSIAGEATALLRSALFGRDERKQEVGRVLAGGSPFKQRFARTAKTLVIRAQELARDGGADEVTPAHVMLAMLEDDILRPTLLAGGVTAESVQAALPPPAKPGTVRPPVSADARQMLERALLASLATSL
jgi:plasmid stability protein